MCVVGMWSCFRHCCITLHRMINYTDLYFRVIASCFRSNKLRNLGANDPQLSLEKMARTHMIWFWHNTGGWPTDGRTDGHSYRIAVPISHSAWLCMRTGNKNVGGRHLVMNNNRCWITKRYKTANDGMNYKIIKVRKPVQTERVRLVWVFSVCKTDFIFISFNKTASIYASTSYQIPFLKRHQISI